jgi:hypothetical protein
MTLDPGHFHAALVQKFMYPGGGPPCIVYAPAGLDLDEHLKRIERFNTRTNTPTLEDPALHRARLRRPAVRREARQRARPLRQQREEGRLHPARGGERPATCWPTSPWPSTPEASAKLQRAFTVAAEKKVLLYDIMTERFEITTALQRELSRDRGLFGELIKGHAGDPAITKESVHHFSKLVAGAPLKRPAWFFDTRQQGEGIVDVTTHLVDLVQWEAYPEVTLDPVRRRGRDRQALEPPPSPRPSSPRSPASPSSRTT